MRAGLSDHADVGREIGEGLILDIGIKKWPNGCHNLLEMDN